MRKGTKRERERERTRTILKPLQEFSQYTCRFASSIVNNRPSIGPLIDEKWIRCRAHQFAQLRNDVMTHIRGEPLARCRVDLKRRRVLCCVLQFASATRNGKANENQGMTFHGLPSFRERRSKMPPSALAIVSTSATASPGLSQQQSHKGRAINTKQHGKRKSLYRVCTLRR